MKQLLRKHIWAIVFAIFMGGVIIVPHIWFRIEHADIFKGIGFGGSDEAAYMTRIQEVKDGHWSTANYVWKEGKDKPYLLPPLSEMIVVGLGKVIGTNTLDTVTAGRFLFPAINFLLIYAFVFLLTKKRFLGIIAGASVMMSLDMLDPLAIKNLFLGGDTNWRNFLPYNRLVSPQVHLIFFYSFLILFWYFYEKRKIIFTTLSGIVLGLSFYTYPFTWSFLFAFLAIFGLIMLIKRDWAVVRGMILLGMIALVIAIPYFVNLYYATQEPLYERAVAMQGFVKTHAPVFGSLVLVMLAGFLLLFKRADLKRYWYMLALVVTPLAVLNQQVITGTYFYSDHYHWYYHKPLFVIIFTIIVFELIFRIFKDKKTQKAIALFAFIVIMLVNLCSAYRIQKDSYMYWEGITRGNQRYGPLMDWFNANAKLDEVVMGDESVSMYIPMFTSLNGLNTEDGHYFLSSDEQQVLERTFISYRLNGVTKESARDYFYTKRGYISGQIYGQMYRKLYGDYDKIPDEKLDFVIAKYIEFLNQPLEHYLKKYNMDYLVKDESGSPGWRHEIDKIESLELIAEVESFDIYKFK